MKKLLSFLLAKTGYQFIKTSYFKNFIHQNKIRNLDFYFLLKQKFGDNKELCVFDVGANEGQTAKKLRSYFPDAVIYCFEPVLDTYNKMLENLKDEKNIYSFNKALGAAEGHMEIYHREYSEWNSLVDNLVLKAKENGGQAEIIKIITLDDFVNLNSIKRIHLFKSDTEGFELEVLKGAQQALQDQLIDFIYIEVGFSKGDLQHFSLEEIKSFLESYGYLFCGLFENCEDPDFNFRIHYANALFARNTND